MDSRISNKLEGLRVVQLKLLELIKFTSPIPQFTLIPYLPMPTVKVTSPEFLLFYFISLSSDVNNLYNQKSIIELRFYKKKY